MVIADFKCTLLVRRDDGGTSVDLLSLWDNKLFHLDVPRAGNDFGIEQGGEFRLSVEKLEKKP